MPICNTDNFITQLQSEINSIVGDNCGWCQVSSLGGEHTTAIKTDGTLWTWGKNTRGELGDGTVVSRCSPGTIAGGGSTWFQVAAGGKYSTAAIKTDGTLWTWGCNNIGKLGDGTTVDRCSPGTVAGGGTTWCNISTGTTLTVAVKTDGTLWTWGYNGFGGLGDGTTVNRCSPGTVAGGGTTWCQASGGSINAGAIKTDGTLWTWGYNGFTFKLGDGTTVNRSSPGTVAGGGTTWCQVFMGWRHSAAIKTDGTLWTWSCNRCGMLGDGNIFARCSPGTVAGGGTTWCQVSVGCNSSEAIKTDGTLWTWGDGGSGVLGDGTTVSRCSPGTIAGGGTTWCKVFGGYLNISAIKTDGTLWTWGANTIGLTGGQLGNGTTVNRCSPGSVAIQPVSSAEDLLMYASAVAQVTDNRQVSFASSTSLPDIYDNSIPNGQLVYVEDRAIPVISNNECWVALDGRVLRCDAPTRTLFTWGYNSRGQTGDGTTVFRCSPGTVAGGSTTWCQAVFSAAIKTDGTLWTWGCAGFGQLGDGTTVSRCSPGTIWGGNTTWCQVSSSYGSVAAIKCDGTLWTWGFNTQGTLGNGNNADRCSPGTVAGGGTTWCQVSLRNTSVHVLAIKTDGTLWTWGSNGVTSGYGRLGDGTTLNRNSPGTVAGGGTTWCQVSNSCFLSAAIKTDGTLWTWGRNYSGLSSGHLGDGTTLNRCSPGTIAGGGTTWSQVSAGLFHMAAIKTDGTLWTWGGNTCGSLGDGTIVSRRSPGTVAGGGTTWCQVLGLTNNNAALKTDGTLWTWGLNNAAFGNGILGDGTTVNRCSPGTITGGGTNWCQISGGDRIFNVIQVQ